jgi:hypothetical protein
MDWLHPSHTITVLASISYDTDIYIKNILNRSLFLKKIDKSEMYNYPLLLQSFLYPNQFN